MAIPFSVHPRRVIDLPDRRRAMVAIRRALPRYRHRRLRVTGFRDLVFWAACLAWLAKRPRAWVVEVYLDEDLDYGVPDRAASLAWKARERTSAIAYAEGLAEALRRGHPLPLGPDVERIDPQEPW